MGGGGGGANATKYTAEEYRPFRKTVPTTLARDCSGFFSPLARLVDGANTCCL